MRPYLMQQVQEHAVILSNWVCDTGDAFTPVLCCLFLQLMLEFSGFLNHGFAFFFRVLTGTGDIGCAR